jgi:pimeloyl-ACP methyl ester carboxylesterase
MIPIGKSEATFVVAHATGDAVVPFEQGRMLAGLIPGARLVPLESRNHILLESEPAWHRFLEETRSFLAEDEEASTTAAPLRTAAGTGP